MSRAAVRPNPSSRVSNDNLSQMQALESRRLMAATVALPFRLDFSTAVAGTTVDKDGQGTGFTGTQGGSAGQLDINTAKGTLALTADYSTSKPTAALETAFDGTTRGFTITSRLIGPLSNLLHSSDVAGIYFGPDQNNAVKLTAIHTDTGDFLQFSAVVNGQSVTAVSSTYTNIGKFSTITSLDLQLIGDAVTGQVSARYAINGKSYTKLATTLTVPAASKSAFFNSAAKTGVVVSDKHGPITAIFDSFAIDAGVTAYVPVATLSRPQIALSDLTTGGSSAPQTLRITNTGDNDLVISGASISGANAGEFALTNPLSSPITLKSGQRYDFYVKFTATNSGSIRNATLTFNTNDPSGNASTVALRGLGLAGAGGAYEPSLQRIIDTFGFKTNVGQGDPNNNAFDSNLPSADEVTMPRLTRAGSGPVSLDLLGVFANQISKTTIGWYEAGNPQSTHLAGGVTPDKAQSLSPLDDGILTFDPGTGAFGLYGNFTLGSATKPINRNVYSEDILNSSWETNSSKQKKVRFYKLRDADGNVVQNAYIVTFEEYNVTFDQNDIVGIIRNVQPAAAGAELGLENLDGAPAADQLVMSRVQRKDPNLANEFHDISTLRVRNTGNQPLSISGMVLSNSDFVIVSGGGGGAQTLAPNAYVDVKVQFVYNDTSSLGNKLRKATLTISTNDADEPTKTVNLSGIWQSYSENQPNGTSAEPTAELVVEAFGYGTTISTKTSPINTKGVATASGDEVLSELWGRADTGLPVTVRMLATYHQQYNIDWNTHSSVWWYDPTKINTAKGKPTLNAVVTHNQLDSQSVLPRLDGSNSAPAIGSFIPGTQAFGFNIDSYNGTYSQDALNTPNDAANPGHGWRFYVAKDAKGNIIPDTYIAAQDYVKVSWANYDYQDNILLITNVKPVSAPQTVQAVAAAGTADGVAVTWKANTANNITSYNVYRRIAGESSFVKVANVAGTSYSDTNTAKGQTYEYYVTAAAYQGGESAQSGIATATAGSGTITAPAAASNVVATANSATSVTITWADNATNESGFRIERKLAGGTYASVGTVSSNVLTFTDGTTAGSTNYVYRVIAINAAGDSTASNESAVTTPAPNTTPPTTTVLTSANIGNPTPAGGVSTITAGKDYDVSVGGVDIYGTSDSFNFLYGQKTGDFDVSVRVAGLSNVDPSTMAGLMVRESLAANSRNINIKAQIKGLRLTSRSSTGGTTAASGAGATNFPNQYLRLQRVGNTFNTYTSTDGVNWTAFGSVTMTLGSTVYVGLATCGHSTTTATANYRGYGDTGTTTTPPPADTTPAAPTNLAATASSPTRVGLTWSDNATNETGYRIERQTAGVWAALTTIAAGSTTYTDNSVSPETTYNYRVVATGSTDSAASNISAVTTPPAVSGSVTLAASADTYVTDSATTTNYGTAPTLQVKKSSAGYNRQAYIKFDISTLSTVNTAKLRLFVSLNTADSVQIAVAGTTGTLNETATTWSNKPAAGSTLGTAIVNNIAGTWVEIDVSNYVKSAKAAGQTSITLSLAGTASTTAYVNIASREAGANGPQLAVT